jgi:hypothetical protein
MATLAPLYTLRADDRRGNFFMLHKVLLSGAGSDTVPVPEGLRTAWVIDPNRLRFDKTGTVLGSSDAPAANTVGMTYSKPEGTPVVIISFHRGGQA